jgi:hypothetical protein
MSRQRRERRRRSGAGTVLIVAALFIAVLVSLQLAQSFLLTQVTDQTTRSSVGRLCAQYAESAMAEARLVIARQVNTPDHLLFTKVRQAGLGSAAAHAIDEVRLELRDLPHTQAMLATEQGKSYELVNGVTCALAYARPLVPLYPAEFEGTVAYRARVRWRSERSIVREIEESQGFKVGHAVLPSPLSRYPLVIRNPERVLMGKQPGDPSVPPGVDVNDLVRIITTQYIPQVKTQYDRMMSRFSEGRSVDFIRRVQPLYEKLANDSGTNHFGEVDRIKGMITPFPPIPAGDPYTLVGVTQPANLTNLNIQLQLAARSQPLAAALARIEQVAPLVERGFNDNDRSEAAYQRNVELSTQMLDAVRTCAHLLGVVAYFQQHVKVVDSGSAQAVHARMKQLFALLDPMQMAAATNLMSARAFYRINEQPPGPNRLSVDAQWERLKARLGPETGFGGLVYVDNTQEPLTLSGELSGLLTIAVRGPVIIDGLKNKFADDVLTVIALGGPASQIAVKGQVSASLVVRGAALGLDPATTINGTLVVDEISLARMELFGGAAQPDARLAAGAERPQFFYVAFSPWTRSRNTSRM